MSKFQIIKADITTLYVDAIVNAANETLLGGGGVDGAIHRAAGPELLKECLSLRGCKVGEAKITKGYNLKAPYIIHTVGPIYYGLKNDPISLKNCYVNSLKLAKSYSLHSIAFPAISTGAYRYPLKEATNIAFSTVLDFFNEYPDYNIDVVFCCFDELTYQTYLSVSKNFS